MMLMMLLLMFCKSASCFDGGGRRLRSCSGARCRYTGGCARWHANGRRCRCRRRQLLKAYCRRCRLRLCRRRKLGRRIVLLDGQKGGRAVECGGDHGSEEAAAAGLKLVCGDLANGRVGAGVFSASQRLIGAQSSYEERVKRKGRKCVEEYNEK